MPILSEKCGQCRVPQLDLMPENVDAWAFWNKLSGQQNMAFGGKCGPLIFSSIQFIFDIYAVENKQETFEKIQTIHSIYVERTLKDEPQEQRIEDDYCKACRIAKKDNCRECDRNIYKVE